MEEEVNKTAKREIIKPELGGGLRDYLPEDMIPRARMFDIIREVFERFGYLPLDTPIIEKKVILTGGDPSFSMNIFEIKERDGDSDLALRFDLTVPLARVVSAYPQDVRKPFKRYQVGKVCRGEKPQAGRFREFAQFDADVVGSSSMMADAEIIALMSGVLNALGFKNFLIRVNDRKILNGLATFAGFPEEKKAAVLRAVDKLDRDGWESVKTELTRQPENQWDESATALSEEQAAAIKRFLDLRVLGQEETLKAVENLMKDSPLAMEGASELREIIQHVRALGVPDDKWTIDLSVARGLGYYTGPVFEAILTDLPQIGSVFSGGRYDDLVSRFSANIIPATGASVGVDRIFAAMEQLGVVEKQKSTAKVMILNFDPDCSLWLEEIATVLRNAGIATDLYLGQEDTLKGQLVYALNQEVPLVIIAGSEEKARGVVQLKDVKARTQSEVGVGDLVQTVKSTA